MTTTAQAAAQGAVQNSAAAAEGHATHMRVLGVSLSDRALGELLIEQPPSSFSALRDVIDLTGTGIVYLGSGRFATPATDRQPYLDPLFAAHSLLTRLPQAAALVSTSPDVEHPFNYARRILTLDHFSRGRAGAVVGTRDRRADRLSSGTTPWTDQPTGPELTADFLRVLRKLFNSWPLESIVVDKDTGRFADASRIVRIDHEGLYSVAGPLNAPSSVQGEPPLGLHRTLGRTEISAARDAEFALIDETEGVRVETADPTGPFTIGFLAAVDSVADLPAVVERLKAGGADDAGTTPAKRPGDFDSRCPTGAPLTLRERLGLGPRSFDLTDNTAAFPA